MIEDKDEDGLVLIARSTDRKKRKDNIEFVTDLMSYSRSGALIQCFVIEALRDYATRMEKVEFEANSLISAPAWRRCAEEVLYKLAKQYGEKTNEN